MATKQKLSAEAAKAKAIRDLACANTPKRKKARAENQKFKRAHEKKNGKGSTKGKDVDHKSGKLKSVKNNRGNDGEGTKKEGKKKYKDPNKK